MDRTTQRELVERVLDQHANRTSTLAESTMRIPAERYVSDALHRREERGLFRRAPAFACLSVDVAEPGDSFPLVVGGVPIVIVRAALYLTLGPALLAGAWALAVLAMISERHDVR